MTTLSNQFIYIGFRVGFAFLPIVAYEKKQKNENNQYDLELKSDGSAAVNIEAKASTHHSVITFADRYHINFTIDISNGQLLGFNSRVLHNASNVRDKKISNVDGRRSIFCRDSPVTPSVLVFFETSFTF